MGSAQKGSVYQMGTVNQAGSKMAVSAQRAAQVSLSPSPQRGPTFSLSASSQQSAEIYLRGPDASPPSPPRGPDTSRTSSPQRGSVASRTSSPQRGLDASRATSPQRGPDPAPATCPPRGPSCTHATSPPRDPESSARRGTDGPPRQRAELAGGPSPQRRAEFTQNVSSHVSGSSRPGKVTVAADTLLIAMQRSINPQREEAPRRGSLFSGSETTCRTSFSPDTKGSPPRSTSVVKTDVKPAEPIRRTPLQPEPDSPSGTSAPQGTKCPRRHLIHPKDEATQTDPPRRGPVPPGTRPSQKVAAAPDPESAGRDSGSPEAKPPPRGSACLEAESAFRISLRTEAELAQRTLGRPDPEAGHRGYASPEVRSPSRVVAGSEVESARRVHICPDPEPPRKVSLHPETESPRRVSGRLAPDTSRKAAVQLEADAFRRAAVQLETESPRRVSIRSAPDAPRRAAVQLETEASRRATVQLEMEAPWGTVVRPESGPSLGGPPAQSAFGSSPGPVGYLEPIPEFTPRPLPPRALPRYGPESPWWALLNPEAGSPSRSRPGASPPRAEVEFPDPEPETGTTPPAAETSPADPFVTRIDVALDPLCEELALPREDPAVPPSQPKRPSGLAKPRDALRIPGCPSERIGPVRVARKESVPRFSAFFLDVSEEMYSRVIWWLKDEEIRRFLEDPEEAELAQFVQEFPGGDGGGGGGGCRRPEPEEPSSRDPEALPAAPEPDPRPPARPWPPDGHQHISAPAPLSPLTRPRSPWGKLDPYDSSEDDKEYVGFATLPNQVHRKSVKKGFDFTLMVAGESGLGKSTLINSLFLTDLYRDRRLLNAEERITQTVEITKHSVEIEEKGIKLRLTIVDTPGFGDAVNNTECWKPLADYIDQQFEQYFRDESGLNRKNIQDNRVHCCLYFISPFGHGLRPLDVEFLKALHQRVNIVPILAKADTLTPPEVEHKKRKIREEIERFGIRIYQFPDCDSDEDEDFKLQDQALKDSIPFAVIGSNTVVEARGRRVRGRLYPWGIVEVENPAHCDFVKLRTMLVRTHMQDLKDVTRETHYENYRAQCIQSMTRMVVKERNRN
ncbi:septin-4 isoform X2 [Ornithorhynchus anatinus]|nr:septin-4 isoform X2 [Ornithorhynchus anatinus]